MVVRRAVRQVKNMTSKRKSPRSPRLYNRRSSQSEMDSEIFTDSEAPSLIESESGVESAIEEREFLAAMGRNKALSQILGSDSDSAE